MSLVIRTGFLKISTTINFSPSTIQNGKKLAQNHVKRVEELHRGKDILIKSCVIPQTSATSKHPYEVTLYLSCNRVVVDVTCTCVAKEGKKCKHIYAVIHYINTDRSLTQTSFEQQWGKPSARQLGKQLYSKGIAIAKLFPKRTAHKLERNHAMLSRPVRLEEIEQPCALKTLLAAYNIDRGQRERDELDKQQVIDKMEEAKTLHCECCVVNFLLFTAEHPVYSCALEQKLQGVEKEFYEGNIVLNDDDIVQLCKQTRRQSKSPKWFRVRYLRISASSKAHCVNARKTKSAESLVREFLHSSEPVGVAKKNMSYGLRNEPNAILEYEKKYSVLVVATGVTVSKEQPWLCASPDGVVVEEECITKLLEIKCPISCEAVPVVDKTGEINVKYLHYQNNHIELKTSHSYYTQCQVQLYVTGLTICDLYIWSRKGSFLIPVHRDEAFLREVIPKLETFYFDFFLKPLVIADQENYSNSSFARI